MRINKIVEILKSKKGVSVKELASMLCVSEMTIRRDLAVLEEHNLIQNVCGAAMYSPQDEFDLYDYNNQKILMKSEKIRIGEAAAKLLTDGDIIIIDNGTTTAMMAKAIPDDIKITALFYNLKIMLKLKDKPNVDMIFAGGYFRANSQMFASEEGVSLIKKTRGTKVFVSAGGVHESLGLTCINGYELATKHAIMESCLQKILLADSSKFDKIQSVYFADLKDFDTVITDTGLSEQWREHIISLGIELICV